MQIGTGIGCALGIAMTRTWTLPQRMWMATGSQRAPGIAMTRTWT